MGGIGGWDQSTSAHVNILESTIVLHTLVPLSLTFAKEKMKTPSYTLTQTCIICDTLHILLPFVQFKKCK